MFYKFSLISPFVLKYIDPEKIFYSLKGKNMRKYFFLIFYSFFCLLARDKMTDDQILQQSFPYFRIGVIYPGAEVAIGYRFRKEGLGDDPGYGHGPLINISASYWALPFISAKYELYRYPTSWNGGYLGIMFGVGVGNINNITYWKNNWTVCPTLEFVYGKEFLSKDNKKRFYYFSIFPPFIPSFNYGWSF